MLVIGVTPFAGFNAIGQCEERRSRLELRRRAFKPIWVMRGGLERAALIIRELAKKWVPVGS